MAKHILFSSVMKVQKQKAMLMEINKKWENSREKNIQRKK